MSDVSRDDVVAVFGEMSDAAVAQIIATGATRAELAQARAWAAHDATVQGHRPKLPLGPVGHVVEIVERSGGSSILGSAGSKLE